MVVDGIHSDEISVRHPFLLHQPFRNVSLGKFCFQHKIQNGRIVPLDVCIDVTKREKTAYQLNFAHERELTRVFYDIAFLGLGVSAFPLVALVSVELHS